MPAGELEHIPGSDRADIERFDGVGEVMDRAGERSQMENAIQLAIDFQRTAHVPLAKLEPRVALKMLNIASIAGNEIVDGKNLMAFGDQPVTQMGADESGGPGH